MTRDEIYDHLAQVYLGKREKAEEKKKRQFNVWLLLNIVITLLILTSAFYGFTAFLTRRSSAFSRNNVIFSLTNGPIRIKYNLNQPFPQIETFSLSVPTMDISKYKRLVFSIRGEEGGFPGVVKIVVKNRKNETASFYVNDVKLKWQQVDIPLEEFSQVTDWTVLTDVSFVVEAWNVQKKKGMVLVDNICFSS